ncbi:MAG: MMPL family transporter [Pseudomonadota bacterium]
MRRPLTILAVLALVGLASFALRVQPRFSFEDFLPAGNDTVREEQRLRALFDVDGRRELYLAASKGAQTWSPAALKELGACLRSLQARPWLRALHSAYTTPLASPGDETLGGQVPLATVPDDAAGVLALRQSLEREVLPGLRWLSRDGFGLLAILELQPEAVRDLAQASRIVEEVETALQPLEQAGWQLHLAGIPAMEARSTRFLAREAGQFFVATLLIMALLLWLSFGQKRLTAGALGLGLAAVVVQLGVLGALGLPLTLLTLASPVVVLVVVLCDVIHVVSDHLRLREQGLSADDARAQAMRRGVRTCLWTSVTSAVGFASFALTSIPVIRQFAVATSLGILAGYAVAMLGLPWLLGAARPIVSPGALDLTMEWLVARCRQLVERKPERILVAASVLMAVALALAPLLRVDSRILEELADRHPVVVDNRYFSDQFLGESRIDLVLGVPATEDAMRTDSATLLEALSREARTGHDVLGVHSALGVLTWVDALLGGDGKADADDARLAQLELVAEGMAPGVLERYRALGDDGKLYLRLELRFADPGANATLALLDALRERALALRPDITVGFAGRTYLTLLAYHLLTRQALWGFALAAVGIAVLMVLALGSLRLGALAMVPNLGPLVVVLGLYGALGVTLKPSSMLFFSVALGLAVDDTLHVLRRVRALHRELAWGTAARAALTACGPAMIRSSLVVGLGFAVLLASTSKAIAMLGLTVVLTAVVALAADLLLVPAGAIVLGRRGPRAENERDPQA